MALYSCARYGQRNHLRVDLNRRRTVRRRRKRDQGTSRIFGFSPADPIAPIPIENL